MNVASPAPGTYLNPFTFIFFHPFCPWVNRLIFLGELPVIRGFFPLHNFLKSLPQLFDNRALNSMFVICYRSQHISKPKPGAKMRLFFLASLIMFVIA
jgi:hypothetical protein